MDLPAETETIADHSRRTEGWKGLGAGALSTLVLPACWLLQFDAPGAFQKFTALGFAGLSVVTCGGFVFHGCRSLWRSHRLGVPTLTVARGTDLGLGSVAVARFERVGGSRRARRSVSRLSADLVGQEQVAFGRGDAARDFTKEIFRRELAVTREEVADSVVGQVIIKVPVDVPPSMTLRHSRIYWQVQVRVQAEGFGDDVGTFALEVRPTVKPA